MSRFQFLILKIQKAIADIYSVYITEKNQQTIRKTQIRDICPILIKRGNGKLKWGYTPSGMG